MKLRTSIHHRHRRRLAAVALLSAGALLMSACGSRLDSAQQAEARGSSSNGVANSSSTNSGAAANQASDSSVTTTTACTATTTTTAAATTTTAKATTTTSSKKAPTTTSTSTTTLPPCTTTTTAPGSVQAVGPTGSGPVTSGDNATTTTVAGGGGASSGPCGPNGTQAPSGGNGGATATGVTASTITVGNIASISGVAPGLTQSAQQATEAWAAYVNSTGGICGRQIKVQPFDDANDSGTNYSDAEQACTSDFAMVGNASGFDDGSAQAVGSCGIPDMASEVSTEAAGTTADIFGASPGNAHYWSLGPANYIKATYPNAIQHAAMIYLNVSATQTQAEHEVAAYESVGFKYVYDTSTTPTNANYAANVQAMQSAGAEYVTEYSDADSAERLLEAMQQANYAPQVVDWFSEEYSPQFAQQTEPESNGDLVLMSATVGYSDAPSNPELQLMESWMNRVAPGYHQDIFAILAWSAGLAFEQAAKQVGPDLTRSALISAIQGITNWTGDGITPPVNIGQKIPSKCFFYEKIENGAFQRVYPTTPNTFDCNSGFFQY